MNQEYLVIEGATQNNLKCLNFTLPLKKLIVITGVSGSGKSSLAFDTIYAEGQRRYVETFSSYARQFLQRMDRPKVKAIEGIPPAIAIDQINPVRTSRSTVGTMTELNDHIKLLFARASSLFCRKCGRKVCQDSPDSIFDLQMNLQRNEEILISFKITIPHNFTKGEITGFLAAQGYRKFLNESEKELEVIQDRVTLCAQNRDRIIEDLEAAMKHGNGLVTIHSNASSSSYSSGLHCAECDIFYKPATPGLFSFNSPIGACEKCRGFGRVIGIDLDLIIPDWNKSIQQGAIKPWQTASYSECLDDLLKFAKQRKIPLNVPWKNLTQAQREWVIEGEGARDDGKWYGIRRFFAWLETKSYKMHIRVLLSRYRAYQVCPECDGARLKADAMLWRLGDKFTVYHIMQLPIDELQDVFGKLHIPGPLDEAAQMVFQEIRTRLKYLIDVGLGYLTLDRQSRTLSGGEVQRINLTTALGTSLVNALFVLDEPSIGLHSRDIGRLIKVLHNLRDTGNTLIVVEHDPEVIRAADYVLDLGPGPGERGGEIVYSGTLEGLLKDRSSITARYLNGNKHLQFRPAETEETGNSIEIRGAAQYNLQNVSVDIPLDQLVCITGVSGSGKSTLVKEVCYYGIRRLKGKPVESPGKFDKISGHEKISDVIMVDQAPIGKTTRSNPASYIGAFEGIRKLFASQPLAKERKYLPGTFSFNSGSGRCPSCGGNGFEHIEMQFLSDIYLRCPDCDGKRFRPETLEVELELTAKKNIADVLEMTVDEACRYFADYSSIVNRLEPLRAVGLSYMRLGQPLPALSGGEAQRLKLAGFLAQGNVSGSKGILFLFDEPTTGLHFSDIEVLMKALRSLIESGHSVVVIEHNLDVISSADWIIDLGPEGGAGGGKVVFTGTPDMAVKCMESHTGKALSNYISSEVKTSSTRKVKEKQPVYFSGPGKILIRNAREHNLNDIDISIPRDQFTVITGVSGSGKSTVAFDILFAEGQRRYLESLNAYARQFIQPASRPDIDSITGVPPTVAIEQRTSRGGRKSTVATVTEIYHFLRLLFVKLGVRYCPDCSIPIIPRSQDAIIAEILKSRKGKKINLYSPLVINRKGIYTDLASWAAGKGFAFLRVDGELVSTDKWPRLDRFKEHTIELPSGEINVRSESEQEIRKIVSDALQFGKGTLYLEIKGRGQRAESVMYSTKWSCPRCQKGFEELDPRQFSFNSKHGWCSQCFGTGLQMSGFDENQTGEEIWWNEWWEGDTKVCSSCNGRRLNREALSVLLNNKPISDYVSLPVSEAHKLFSGFKSKGRDAVIAEDIITELLSRLDFLEKVGLQYLSLDRSAPTLSGGEAQRIRLAAQLGSNLKGVCYILDEPTIGLHSRDNEKLLQTLFALKEKGNTVVVVEHDEETIRRAEHIIDLGPGGGKNGGRLLAEGTFEDILADKMSITGEYFRKPLNHSRERRPVKNTEYIEVKSANLHNLKSTDVRIPLRRLVCVTGVSGSGKSTLVRDILYDNLKDKLSGEKRTGKSRYYGCSGICGWDSVARILEVDQRPIGKTPRSCPATYVGFMDEIRKLFARAPEAIMRGYTASRFSFNTDQGRCLSCDGQGVRKIEMSFLPDVNVVCESCGGQRFTPETLAVKFRDKSISDILMMSVDEGVEFFAAHHKIHKSLRLLQETGLGYLSLGQQSPTLSGGEAQRIKLVTELGKSEPAAGRRPKKPGAHTLYVLDEPTVGLHMADIDKLTGVLHRLVDNGNTVVIIEHNLDMIAEADWIIDLGPEGGDRGGSVVAQGTPEGIIRKEKKSYTAKFLKDFMASRC